MKKLKGILFIIYILSFFRLHAGADLLNIQEVATSIAKTNSTELQGDFTTNLSGTIATELQGDFTSNLSTTITTDIMTELNGDFKEDILHHLREDYGNRNARNSIFGQKVTGQEVTQFAALFAYPRDTRKYTTTVSNGGTATESTSTLILQTSVTANGTALYSSKRALQYVPGKEAYAKFTAVFSAGAGDLKIGVRWKELF